MLRKRNLTKVGVVASALAAGLTLAVFTTGATATTKTPTRMVAVSGGTLTWAEEPGTPPNYIFPMVPPQNFSVATFQLVYVLYRPLYWFGTGNNSPALNEQVSLAHEPVYTNGGRTVTIKMKGYKWSNGETVDAKDVLFWSNLMKDEGSTSWGEYISGPTQYPGNVTNVVANDATDTVTFTLNKAYSTNWYTYNELGQVTPLPIAWDITHAGAKPGSGGCSSMSYVSVKAGAGPCANVYAFLSSKNNAGDEGTWGSNPLWKTVDGPFSLSSFDATTGGATLVKNTKYSGTPKPMLNKLVYAPFTTDTSEFGVLAAGKTLNIGYVPYENVPAYKGPLWCGTHTCAGKNNAQLKSNYYFDPELDWQFSYFGLNYLNGKYRAILKQLYIRQAMQSLQNQTLWGQLYFNGYAAPTYGPVPVFPPTNLADNFEKSNPFPYSPSHAKSLLQAHGWTIHVGGADTCARPGTSASECGKGIAKGASLSFPFEYATGIASFDAQMKEMAASWEQAGIRLNEEPKSFAVVISEAFTPCQTGKPCPWVINNWGGGWVYSPDYYPTGEALYVPGSGSNVGQYNDPEATRLIDLTNTHSSIQNLYNYENYMATHLPVIFQPVGDQLWEYGKNVCGFLDNQNILLSLTPEFWHFCKAA